MNKKDELLKKNSKQLRSLVVDATSVKNNSRILGLADGLGGHSIIYTTQMASQSILTLKVQSSTNWYYFLSLIVILNNFYSYAKSIIILLSGRKAVEIPCGEGLGRLGR